MLYLTIIYKFLYYYILFICVILSHFVWSWMMQYLLSYVWLNLPAHQICVFTRFFFLHKTIYYSIRLIHTILTHMVSSWAVQYLLSYLQFTMSAYQNHDQSSKSPFKKLWCKYDACPLQNPQVLQRMCIIPHDHYHHTSSHICDTCFQIKLFHNIHCTKCFSSFCYLGYFLSAFCWTLLIIIRVSWYLGNSLMRHINSVWSQLVVVGHCMHMEFTSLIFYN